MLFTKITAEEFAEIRARESFAKGEKAGEVKKQCEIAKKLKSRGTAFDEISEITGIPLNEIESL